MNLWSTSPSTIIIESRFHLMILYCPIPLQILGVDGMSFFESSRWAVLLGTVLLMVLSSLAPVKPTMETSCPLPKEDLDRNSFPKGLIFGTSSSAYQYEGAAHQDGKGTSIWDTYTHVHPDCIADRSNGDKSIDFYYRYKEDIQRTKELNVDAFRFSISWTRILPYGSVSGGINQKGIDFYNNLIDEAISKGLVPFATIVHWDTPQALQDKYDGFLSHMIVKDFQDYSNICFQAFGDRVKHWITINEPWASSYRGHDQGDYAPGRCSAWVNGCKHGNSATEPYIVAHNILLAHAATVHLYREKYQASQNGELGLTLNTYWFEPYSNSAADTQAARRALDFMYGWFMNPITYGDYPRSMREFVGDRLPKFSEEETMKLRGSYDFIGINYYSSYYAEDASHVAPVPNHLRYETDSRVRSTAERNGIPIGLKAASFWLYIYPKGIRYLLNYTKDTYMNPTIYITENGYDELRYNNLSLEESLNDRCRIKYYGDHLRNVLKSINDYDVNVKGFFVWSLADNFEWESGFNLRFGLYYIDYENDLKRYPKRSVEWLKKIMKKKSPGDGLSGSRPFGFDFMNPARSDQ